MIKNRGNPNWDSEEEDEKVEKGVEVTYDLTIKLNKNVDDKIRYLTHKYPDEISAFLTGEIKDGVIIVDGLLFPHQDVSTGSVEVEPKNLIKLRKEYGDECMRIIGHWHSHHNMGAFWSATDDEFIKSYSRTKDTSIFFVSSTSSKIKMMVVNNKPFKVTLDNLKYDIEWDSGKFEADLKKMIDEKVTKKTFVTNTYSNFGWENHQQGGRFRTDQQVEDDIVTAKINSAIRYNVISKTITINDLDLSQAQALINDTLVYHPKMLKISKKDYGVKYLTQSKKEAIGIMKDIKFYLKDIFEDSKPDDDKYMSSTNNTYDYDYDNGHSYGSRAYGC